MSVLAMSQGLQEGIPKWNGVAGESQVSKYRQCTPYLTPQACPMFSGVYVGIGLPKCEFAVSYASDSSDTFEWIFISLLPTQPFLELPEYSHDTFDSSSKQYSSDTQRGFQKRRLRSDMNPDINPEEYEDIPDWLGDENYDQDEIYNVEPEDILPGVPHTNVFLYEDLPEYRPGAVKTTRKGGERGQLLFNKSNPDYDLAIERLVWVDGWSETTGPEDSKQQHDPMTLVVLNFSLDAKRDSSKILFAYAEMRFKSEKRHGLDPTVVAWGPFRRPDSWNASTAHKTHNIKGEAKLAVGGAGQQGTGGLTIEDETAWDRIDFDGGRSKRLYNLDKDNLTPHGVLWRVTQNRLYNQGITPEFRTAVLIKRHSSEDYRVDLRLHVLTGKLTKAVDGIQRFLGFEGGESVKWRATPRPGEEDNCYDEGVHIVESIDTNNLSKLITDPKDSTNLNPSWLNTWDRVEVPQQKSKPDVSEANAGQSLDSVQSDQKLTSELETPKTQRQPDEARAARDRPPIQPPKETPQQCTHNYSDSPQGPTLTAGIFAGLSGLSGTDYGRLVSLEARTAQAETRIAIQDQIILRLQQTLADLKQVVSASAKQAH